MDGIVCPNCRLPNNSLVDATGFCGLCHEASKQEDDGKTLDALKRCRETAAVVDSESGEEILKRVKGQLEATLRQIDRTSGEITKYLDTLD